MDSTVIELVQDDGNFIFVKVKLLTIHLLERVVKASPWRYGLRVFHVNVSDSVFEGFRLGDELFHF